MNSVERELGKLVAGAINRVNSAPPKKANAPVAAEALKDKPKNNAPKYTPHKLCSLLPLMSPGELDELKWDIEKHGVLEPVVIFEGQILDGRHRYEAARDLKIDCPTVPFGGKDPAAFVLSMNLHRRHLNAEQKRELINALLKFDPKASDRSIAKKAKVDHKTVGAVRARAVEGGEIPHHAERVVRNGLPFTMPAAKALRTTKSREDIIRYNLQRPVDAYTGKFLDNDANQETVAALGHREELAALLLAWAQASPDAREQFVALKSNEIASALPIMAQVRKKAAA